MSKAGESQGEVVNPQEISLLADPYAAVHENECWGAVDRVLESAALRRCPRLKEFLRFIAERTLAGETDRLTESEIGRQVFERGDDYVPTDDSIVRSSARQLRMKLQGYYETEGRLDRWVIEIPKGGYVVHFRERPTALGGMIAEPLAFPTAASAPPASPWVSHPALVCSAVLLLASLVLNIWLFRRNGWDGAVPAKLSLLGQLVMNSPRPTQFIMDDYAFVLLNSSAKSKFTMEDYASRSYVNPQLAPTVDPSFLKLWNLLSTRYLVSLGAAAAAEDALRAVPQQQKLVVRHARNIAPRELKQGNFILFGSPPNNPWADLFEEKLNFHKSSAGFVNRHPLPGEQATYTPQRSLDVNSGTGYARLAYLPNSPDNSFILLLTGINMVTSEAAAEFATDPARIAELLKITGAESLKKLPHFEVLLQTSAVDTTPKEIHVIAYRRMD